jgi:hypothetical protein
MYSTVWMAHGCGNDPIDPSILPPFIGCGCCPADDGYAVRAPRYALHRRSSSRHSCRISSIVGRGTPPVGPVRSSRVDAPQNIKRRLLSSCCSSFLHLRWWYGSLSFVDFALTFCCRCLRFRVSEKKKPTAVRVECQDGRRAKLKEDRMREKEESIVVAQVAGEVSLCPVYPRDQVTAGEPQLG